MHVNDIGIPSYSSISTGTYHPAKQGFPSSSAYPTSSTRSLAMPTVFLLHFWFLWLMLFFHGEFLNQLNGNSPTRRG